MQKYVLAKESVKVSDLQKAEAVKLINKYYLEILFNLSWGSKADEVEIKEDDRILTCGKLYDLICDKYNSLTVDELKAAFLNGAMEDYGKFYGLGLKTLSDWIRAYSNDENKKKAMAEYNRMIDMVKIKPELTPEEKEQLIINGCLHFWDEYKNKEMIRQFIMPVDRVCRIYYDLLVKLGIINYSKDQLKVFKAKAEEIYLAQLNQSKLNRQISKTTYEQMLTSVIDNDNRPLFNLRGKLALLEYFDFLISNNKHLKELLK